MAPFLHKAIIWDEETTEIGEGSSKHSPSLLEMQENSCKREERHEADRSRPTLLPWQKKPGSSVLEKRLENRHRA